MSGGIVAAGDIATGALLGRAVEPRAGEGDGSTGHGVCLNCGTALIGEFCHACGQNGHVHKTLSSIGHDLLHGVFHFEGKVWRTLPMLIAHPGTLTRRYIDGERARFVSPLALFLFMVFLMFAALHSVGGEGFQISNRSPEARARVDARIATTQKKLIAAEQREQAGQAPVEDEGVDELKTQLVTLRNTRAILTTGTGTTGTTGGSTFDNPHTGWDRLDHAIAKINANPDLALYKLQASAYKYSWALIPISVPFIALLFLWRRRFKMYDHAIFVTYSLAFMMLLVTVVTVAMRIGVPGWFYGPVIVLAPPVHMFAQLRGAYELRWWSAGWRLVALFVFSILTLVLFAILLLSMDLLE